MLLDLPVEVAHELQTSPPSGKISDLRPYDSRARSNSDCQVAGSNQHVYADKAKGGKLWKKLRCHKQKRKRYASSGTG